MLNTNFTPFPTLLTERLELRKLAATDGKMLHRLRSDDEVMKYLDRKKSPSVQAAIELIEKTNKQCDEGKCIMWGIALKETAPIIGTICIWKIIEEHYRGEIGYILSPDHHRKGVMNEACEAVINFGFDTINLHSLEAHVNPYNKGSIALLEKNNFVREAYYRENYFWEGNFLDTGVYSLVKTWRKKST